jgi:hypothetical protein
MICGFKFISFGYKYKRNILIWGVHYI